MAGFLTQVGLVKYNAASPQQPVTIKSMAIGSGTGAYNDSILALQDQKWVGDATAPIRKNGGLEFSASLPANVGGFNITEIGLIDKDGDLIAYERLNNPINKPAGLMKLTPYMLLLLTNSANLNLIITDEVNFRHNGTTGRDAADAHPISSITGLQGALDNRVLLNDNQTIGGNKRFEYDTFFKQIVSWWEGALIQFGNKWMKLRANSGNIEASINLDGENGRIDTVGTLYGNGAGLTSLNGSNILSGTIQAARLPIASTTTDGIVRLNNTLVSTSNIQALTAAQGKNLNDQAFGVGQSMQHLTSSRSANTVYTNSTNKTIIVMISYKDLGSVAALNVKVGNVTVFSIEDIVDSEDGKTITFPVPIGLTYTVETTNIITRWSEMR